MAELTPEEIVEKYRLSPLETEIFNQKLQQLTRSHLTLAEADALFSNMAGKPQHGISPAAAPPLDALNAQEKELLIKDLAGFLEERPRLNAAAGQLGLDTEKAAYNFTLSAFTAYLTGLEPTWNNTAVDTPVVANEYRKFVGGFVEARAALIRRLEATLVAELGHSGSSATITIGKHLDLHDLEDGKPVLFASGAIGGLDCDALYHVYRIGGRQRGDVAGYWASTGFDTPITDKPVRYLGSIITPPESER